MYRIYLITFCCLIGCSSKKAQEVKSTHGEWVYETSSEKTDLSLSIYTQSDSLYAEHCFIINNGNKIDCVENSVSIKCKKLSDTQFKGSFFSDYFGEKYEIDILFTNNRMIIEINSTYKLLQGKLNFRKKPIR